MQTETNTPSTPATTTTRNTIDCSSRVSHRRYRHGCYVTVLRLASRRAAISQWNIYYNRASMGLGFWR